jgi:hypothetical protein
MAKTTLTRRRGALTVFAAILLLLLFGLVAAHSGTSVANWRTDIVVIDLPATSGAKQMPPVQFQHDRHTEALKGQDCATCHQKKGDDLVFMFKRIEAKDVEILTDIYHDNCAGCHTEMSAGGKASGPPAGECRVCHSDKPKAQSDWQPIQFNRSLHYRHEASKSVPATAEGNCGACHHLFDAKTKKTFYEKGTEESCYYCHKAEPTKEASDGRTASHSSCLNCHQGLAAVGEKAGPVTCAGCHNEAEQAKIKVVTDVPRLKRNQPDTLLLTSWLNPDEEAAKALLLHMQAVPFNHRVHETKLDSCRSCHHESLKRCGECHTVPGDEKGAFIRLDQAMHEDQASQSCLGCHQSRQVEPACAGCHAQIPKKRFEAAACRQCHAVEKSALEPIIMDEKARKVLAEKTMSNLKETYGHIAVDKIPEKVVIAAMVDKYEAATFPHRRIVKALADKIDNSPMAQRFHGNMETLCQGCHHNTPPTVEPPKCTACRSNSKAIATKVAGDGRPGLKGAYHGQCIGCHQKMGIKEPSATDCIKCHKAKK